MPIPIHCPGCGLTENGPDHLKGKKLKCKRCKQSFVVGGGSAVTKPGPASSKSDLDFGEPAARPVSVRRRPGGRSFKPVVIVLLLGFLLGGGGAAGYLWYTRPEPVEEDTSSAKNDKPANFAWISADKPKDSPPTPHDEKATKAVVPMDK